jgi:hypothetical protein
VPEDEGIYRADLLILLHQGKCHNKVKKLERIFDRSKHGRLRPPREILAILDKGAPSEPQPTVWTLTFTALDDKTPVVVRLRRLLEHAFTVQKLRCTSIDGDEVEAYFAATPRVGLRDR